MKQDTNPRCVRVRRALFELEVVARQMERAVAAGHSGPEWEAARQAVTSVRTKAGSALSSGRKLKAVARRVRQVESQLYELLKRTRSPAEQPLPKGASLALGVDMGGTKILAAGVDANGTIVKRTKVKTGAGASIEVIVGRIAEAVEETVRAVGAAPEQVQGVGIGAPGSIDYDHGKVVLAPNLGWHDVPLKALLEEKLSFPCPVYLENDVNIGVLAESRFGIAEGLANVVGMFWGTGIGGGVVAEGRLLHGGDGMAAEIGHVTLKPGGPKCGCGNRGCLEALASRSALSRQIRRAVATGKGGYWQAFPPPELQLVRSGQLAKALRAGDPLTTKLLAKAARRIGTVAAGVANVLAPELVVIGGGVMESMDLELLPIIRKAFYKHLFSADSRIISVVPSQLADDAGVLGGAALVWQHAPGPSTPKTRGG